MIVVSGISLGLPGKGKQIFNEDNFERLMIGENFIDKIIEADKQSFLEKNLQVKGRDGFTKLTSMDEVTKFAGLAGNFDLSSEFNVPKKITQAMDITSQLGVAAGLRAINDAKISLDNNQLGENERRETGIIFASSFPGYDSLAIEINKFHQENYSYNRKLLFNLLVMANAQLAEIIKAKGPNTQINAACASTSQAIAMAEDWILRGRCRRVIVVSADVATSDQLHSWLGTGFLVLGASSTESELKNAAIPFGKDRNGMILGMGAVGLVLEDLSMTQKRNEPKVALVGSHFVNAAYHASAIDNDHLAIELEYFVSQIEKNLLLPREKFAKHLIYMAHETFTSANGGAARAEINSLRKVFGDKAKEILITNTKGFTGHSMGVNIEDVASVYCLKSGKVPPIANLTEPDPEFQDMMFSKGGTHNRQFVLRYAGGFGSQVVFLFFTKLDD